MSKEKKASFVEKQRVANVVAGAQALTPLGGTKPAAVDAKKSKSRKQSRGK